MPLYKYTLIPELKSESEIRKKYHWVGVRPLMIPLGWHGLVDKACSEIEIVLSPEKPIKLIDYFLASVSESRLKIFITFNEKLNDRIRENAIESLVNEAQVMSQVICHQCGKEIVSGNRYNSRGLLPDCGAHENESDNNEVVKIGKIIEDNLPETSFSFANDINVGEQNDVVYDPEIENANQGEDTKAILKLFDTAAIETLLAEVSTRNRDRDDANKVKVILNKLIKSGCERELKPLPDDGIEFLNQLETDFPNFKEVTDMLRGFNALSCKSEVSRVPPMLLLGPPGVGKTYFSEALAKGMGVPFKVVRMENQQSGAGLAGSSEFWGNSKTGAVFNLLTENNCANPVVVVDELDKAAKDSQYNPLNGLYSLLEPRSATTFCDESLPDLSLNASKITWILTANDQGRIPEPILSRLRIFEIPSPNKLQAAQVARRIYQSTLDESFRLKIKFSSNLDDKVVDAISELSPRRMKLAIETAMGRAALAKRRNLQIEDFDLEEKAEKTKIGFL